MKKTKEHIKQKVIKMTENIKAAKALIKEHINKKAHKHQKLIHRAVHTVGTFATHVEYAILLVGCLGAFFGLSSYASWGGGINEYLIYPLEKVTSVDCRTLDYDSLGADHSCIIDLPIIKNAAYSNYASKEIYTQIYTVLHGAPYSGDSWDMSKGAHLGVDIATSKNTPVYAIAHGVITFAGEKPGYGKVVKMKFDYKGKTYHSIFAHLNKILVKTGDQVTQGQLVAKSGNSGSTFGALGGYHLHWEITNDFYGGHAYGFYGCKDLGLGHSAIIDNGLCRTELYKYTYDPIAFVENSRKNMVHFGSSTPVHIDIAPIVDNGGDDTHDVATDPDSIIVAEVPNDISSLDLEHVNVVHTNGVNTNIPKDIAHEVGEVALANDALLSDLHTNKMVRLTMPPANKLSFKAQEFVKNYTVLAEYKAVSGTELEVTLTVVHNKTQEPFHGILPVSFQFISNDKGVDILKESVALVREGKMINTVTFTGTNTGTITLMLDLLKIGEIKL